MRRSSRPRPESAFVSRGSRTSHYTIAGFPGGLGQGGDHRGRIAPRGVGRARSQPSAAVVGGGSRRSLRAACGRWNTGWGWTRSTTCVDRTRVESEVLASPSPARTTDGPAAPPRMGGCAGSAGFGLGEERAGCRRVALDRVRCEEAVEGFTVVDRGRLVAGSGGVGGAVGRHARETRPFRRIPFTARRCGRWSRAGRS